MNSKKEKSIIAQNRRAKFDYHIDKEIVAGIVLEGWEVKSLRAGKLQLSDTYVRIKAQEAWLIGALINPLLSASTHIYADPTRSRKLLLDKKEINHLMGLTEQKGYTIVALRALWQKGKAKIVIGIAKGKKQHDKRQTIKERDWQREKARTLVRQ
jgi:SsrA-binding protein